MNRSEIHALTGLRALAAWWVVLFHIGGGIPGTSAVTQRALDTGYLGVDLFFVLSGFVIAYNYWDWFQSFDRKRYGRFLWMRLARMYPVHLVTLLFALGLYAAARIQGVPLHGGSSWTRWQFLQQLLLIQHWSIHPVLSWNYAAWSISCEWLAYLVFPALVYLAARKLPRGFRLSVPVSLVLLCLASQFTDWSASSVGLLRIAVDFPAGMAVFQLSNQYGYRLRQAWVVRGCLAAAALVLMLSVYAPGITPHWATLAFPAVIYGLACGQGALSKMLASPPAVFWGRASYSLYMTHGLVLMALGKVAPLSTSHIALRLALALAAVSLAAAATYFLVEEPARRWMKGRLEGAQRTPVGPLRINELLAPSAIGS